MIEQPLHNRTLLDFLDTACKIDLHFAIQFATALVRLGFVFA